MFQVSPAPHRLRAATLALLAGAPLAHPAPTAPGEPGETSPRASSLEEGQASLKRRVLHLANGGLLRGSTRQVDGRWQWRGTGPWKTLEPWQVVRVVEERDLLKRVKARRSAVAEGARPAAELWSWMADEGLYAETLEELGLVLACQPHDPEACAFLATRELFVSLPQPPQVGPDGQVDADALDGYLRFAAGAPPAARELCLSRLPLDRGQATGLFTGELKNTSSRRRELAAVALGRLAPGESGRALLSHAVFDRTKEVRLACASSLGAAHDPALTLPLIRALDSSSPRVSQRAVEALGVAGYAAAAGPLINHLANISKRSGKPSASGARRPPASHIFVGTQRAYLQDFDVEVANGASVADPQINVITGGAVLDVRVLGVQTVSLRTRRATIGRVLQGLTGEDFKSDEKRWLAWLLTQRQEHGEAPTTTTGERN